MNQTNFDFDETDNETIIESKHYNICNICESIINSEDNVCEYCDTVNNIPIVDNEIKTESTKINYFIVVLKKFGLINPEPNIPISKLIEIKNKYSLYSRIPYKKIFFEDLAEFKIKKGSIKGLKTIFKTRTVNFLTANELDKMKHLMTIIVDIWNEDNIYASDEKHFNYSFLIFKFLELINRNDLTHKIILTKDQKKKNIFNYKWKIVCKKLDIKYLPLY